MRKKTFKNFPRQRKSAIFAPDFIAPYIDFAINNLSADTLAKLVSEFYDEIDTVKGAVYEKHHFKKMSDDEKNRTFSKTRQTSERKIFPLKISHRLYTAVLFTISFSEITYYADVKPFIDLYNTDYF
ncbi:MAG: hypothetical protein L6V93_17040 [Clostridiales bacterium]|nr:MAG: hypothetical protein L6V93_17040 [Clostridiales bacterium]